MYPCGDSCPRLSVPSEARLALADTHFRRLLLVFDRRSNLTNF
jgi:hypothetical protein